MKRLVVLIGVQQPGGGLDALQSIGKCLADMRNWALSQGIASDDIKIFTDVPDFLPPNAPVLSIDDIYNWIDHRARDWQPADQLLIYFSGHGMVVGGATLWLLPQAPDKAWEAVNLDSSKELATWSKFGHVVFIGDCCSTVADNEQFDMVRGAPILRNIPPQQRTADKPVDILRAARPGKASLEATINGLKVSPYTVQLVTALGGSPAKILEPEIPNATMPVVLRIRKLAELLKVSVNEYMRANGIVPPGPPLDSVVSTTQWIALFPQLPAPPSPPGFQPPPDSLVPGPSGPGPTGGGTGMPIGLEPGNAGLPHFGKIKFEEDTLKEPEAISLTRENLFEPRSSITSLDENLLEIANGSLSEITGDAWSSKIPDGYHYETECGFYVTGTSVVSAVSRPGVACSRLSSQEVRVDPEVMELVSIEFEGGGGVMVPAIARQIGFLHVEQGRLASLSYEPSGHGDPNRKSSYRQEFERKSSRVRNFRDTLLNVVTGGDVSFTNIKPKTLVNALKKINYGGTVDFSSILSMSYLAYASQQSKRAIPLLAAYSQDRFGFVPFDFKILLTLAKTTWDNFQFSPPFPLLTQGWSLLQATDESLPEDLVDLPKHYCNAAWTHFDASGIVLCRSYLEHQQHSITRGPGGVSSVEVAETSDTVEMGDASLPFEHAAEIVRQDHAIWNALSGKDDDDEEQELLTME
jgi:hypothetical protein